jgi:hypothetical protein
VVPLIGVFRSADRAWRIEVTRERNGECVYRVIHRSMPMGVYRTVAAVEAVLSGHGLQMADLIED